MPRSPRPGTKRKPVLAGRALRLLETGDGVVIGEGQHLDAGSRPLAQSALRDSRSRRNNSNGCEDRY